MCTTKWLIKRMATPVAKSLSKFVAAYIAWCNSLPITTLNNPNSTITDLLSSLRSDSSSFIGTLLATTPTLEEKNALLYFRDCLNLLRKSNSEARIHDLKLILSAGKLNEDETFELQQHLLSSLESLQEEDRILLRNLSKANRNI